MNPIALQLTQALGVEDKKVREWVQVTQATLDAWREHRTPIPLGAKLMIGQLCSMLLEGRKRFLADPQADRKIFERSLRGADLTGWREHWRRDIAEIQRLVYALDDEIDRHPREEIQGAQQESSRIMREVAASMKLRPKGTISLPITVEVKRRKR